MCTAEATLCHSIVCPLRLPDVLAGLGVRPPCISFESEKVKASAQSCLTLCNPMDCSSPASSVHGISQARILEWVAQTIADTDI